jgi:hypothetical protein
MGKSYKMKGFLPSAQTIFPLLIERLDQNIRLNKDEIGEWSSHPALVQLTDGSGYYATLSVYHSIHCMYFLRSCSDYFADGKKALSESTISCTLIITTLAGTTLSAC